MTTMLRCEARMRPGPAVALCAVLLVTGAARADEVGAWSNDWTGNGLVVEAIPDPKVEGVTCHLVRFDRSVIDRLQKGNWFENPSNAGISCKQTAAVTIGDI